MKISHKRMYLYVVTIFVVGLICGLIFTNFLNEASREIVLMNVNEYLKNIDFHNVNTILCHIIIISTLITLSIFIIGLIPLIIFIFYNGFSIGFIIVSLTNIFGIKGFLYAIIYCIITKLLYILLTIVIAVSLIKIIRLIIGLILYKKEIRDSIFFIIRKVMILFLILIINDLFLYFLATKLINIFNFLIF